jgi:glycosyltransferase involved in cell wall biosynthesis
MPHGGVWESKKYIQRILNLQEQENVKLVPIVYDFCPVLTPQFCSKGIRIIFERYMKETLAKSNLVLAISDNTAADAKRWLTSLGHTLPPFKVFRLGDEIAGDKTVKPHDTLPNEFIVCVGTIEARKNHMSLYYAYKLAAQRNINLPPIVIAGRKGWLAEDAYEIMNNDPTIKNKFIFLHGKSDQELAWLYEHSLFSIYPAFYEGWGLPVAESLLRGVPCIASNTSSIPEIAGEIIDYFSPYSPEEILQKISAYALDNNLRESAKKKIKQHYKPTRWDDSYTQVAQALLKL